jgi:subtilisin family serine protease
MWMSGTSLAAPIVSGAAALLLAEHPSWTPDDVKGALMESASATAAPAFAGGIGEVNLAAADAVAAPPNPNAPLEGYVGPGGTFDGSAWTTAVAAGTWSNATDWNATDWNATDWNATDWNATDWNATDWNATDWNATDWNATDWNASAWLP